MKRAFSLFEIAVVIALLGAMTLFSINYTNSLFFTQEKIKTELKSHLNLIATATFQCKQYSNSLPIDANGSLASNSLVSSLECNTSTPYALDGGKGYFMPPSIEGFSEYMATQNGTEFYITTDVEKGSTNDKALQDLNSTYSSNQYELTYDTTKAYLKFYIFK